MEHQEDTREETRCGSCEDIEMGMQSYQDGQNRKQENSGKNATNISA